MTFEISSGLSEATVRTLGGEITSFRRGGTEYIWQGDPAHWEGHAPVLFPVVCYPMDGKIAFDGVEYPMPKHGFASSLEFVPVMIGKDRLVLELRETEETLKSFPFCFSLREMFTVSDNGFTCRFTVKNLDKNEMVFCIGGHPGFNVPFTPEDGSFEDYKLVFDDAEGCVTSISPDEYMDDALPKVDVLKGTNELPLRWSDYDRDSLSIENLPGNAVNLISSKTGRGIRFDYTGFKVLSLWTPIGKQSPLLCIEPWVGLPADRKETVEAKSKKYAVSIKPDESYSVGYSVKIID